MNFVGNTKIELFRKGQCVHREEKHNDVTGLINQAAIPGNFQWLMDKNKLLPCTQWFNGCLLTEGTNDAQTKMLASNFKLVAQASNDAYVGNNLRRGSYNVNESGQITGGYRFVWDWSTSQGNGDIASVCLTRARFGAIGLNYNGAPTENVAFNDVLGTYYTSGDSYYSLSSCQILDYEKGISYYISYTTGTVTIKEYEVNTKQLHLVGHCCGVHRLKATHNISVTLTDYSPSYASSAYTGDSIILFTTANKNGNVNAKLHQYTISTSDWTVSTTEHSYEGFSMWGYHTGYYPFVKDQRPIKGDYIYSMCGYDGDHRFAYIAKLSLTNNADVTIEANPVATYLGDYNNHYFDGPCVHLPNGDMYKVWQQSVNGETRGALYFHNGSWYLCNWQDGDAYYNGRNVNGTNYGTLVELGADTGRNDRNNFTLSTCFPYVSTVNNLQSVVHKSADLTMKLTYTVTEA